EEAQVVLNRLRLDLLAKPFERVAVNPREKPPIAELLLLRLWTESTTQDHSLRFEVRERDLHVPSSEEQPVRELVRRHRSQDLQVTAHQLAHRLLAVERGFRERQVGSMQPMSPRVEQRNRLHLLRSEP